MKFFLYFFPLLLMACNTPSEPRTAEDLSEHHVLTSDSLRTIARPNWYSPDTTYQLTIEHYKNEIEFEDGAWKIFFDDAKQQLAYECLAKNGKLTGDAFTYWKNGKKAYHTIKDSEGKYVKRTEYDLSGNEKQIRLYANGKLLSVKTILETKEVSQECYSMTPRGYSEKKLELIWDSSGFLIEAYVFHYDTTIIEDFETGEIMQVIQEIDIPLDSIDLNIAAKEYIDSFKSN